MYLCRITTQLHISDQIIKLIYNYKYDLLLSKDRCIKTHKQIMEIFMYEIGILENYFEREKEITIFINYE